MPTFTVAGRRVELEPAAVEQRLADVLPEPLHEHFVVVNGRRFPPKQVIALMTGVDRADFTTHQARRVLRRLGFNAARRNNAPEDTRPPRAAREPSLLVEALRPFIGQWVAVRGDDVVVGADTIKEVVGWLNAHGQTAEGLFRVSGTEAGASGAAPL